ncbi:MAG: aldehyde dehydrogenase family protein, partial [Asticcacaulis sp.]|nr:aldehyde dehydrogenase family protein [Asticcacaulis sp.]
MRTIGHFIDGQTVRSAARTADVYDPNIGAVQAMVDLGDAALVDRAVRSSVVAQTGWAQMNPQRRARVMFEFKRL